MANAYLYFNAALYFVLAAWCTLARTSTASAQGYRALDPSGQSEYLVIYGGLQLGLAFLFAYFAWTRQARTGLLLALSLYVPIVFFRIFSVASFWPVGNTTVLVAALEWLLLGAAAWLWIDLRRR